MYNFLHLQAVIESIKDRGTCTVFKGTHFRTFDGKLYAFVGSCKYQLIGDCRSNSFGIRLKNTVNENDVALKRITMKFGKTRVDLQSNKNTKVNDKIVDLPYRLSDKIEITETEESVSVASKMGIKVFWNYVGLLELTVSHSYRKKLCGLCGNFNSEINDDFTTREGILVDDAATFAQSWSMDEACWDTRKYGVRGCNPKNDQRY